MYHLRHIDPRLTGNVYRHRKKCGKPNCRCAKASKWLHSSYQLQYRVKLDGQWKQRTEYVPKSKVKALRQRIHRAKARDTEIRDIVKQFVKQTPSYVKWLQGSLSTQKLAQRCQLPLADTLTEDDLAHLLRQGLLVSIRHLSRRRIPRHLDFLQCIQIASCLIDLFLALQQMSDSVRKAPTSRPNLRLT